MKKILLTICFYLMVDTIIAEDFKVDGILYRTITSNTVEIISSTSYKSMTSIIIPEVVDNKSKQYRVTGIGNFAFMECFNLTEVVIPQSITRIGKSAFYKCHKLKMLKIPNGVEEIAYQSFYCCSSLSSVHLPNSIKKIGDFAFAGCYSLKYVILKDERAIDRIQNLYVWDNKVNITLNEISFSDNKTSIPTPVPNTKDFPNINISSITFSDTDNDRIDANEHCYLMVKITNSGKGNAESCVLKADASSAKGITVNNINIPKISSGETIEVRMSIYADGSLEDGKASIKVSVDEPNGFGCDPTEVMVETKSFVAPKILISDYAVTASQGGRLSKRSPFDLQVLLQNASYGVAEDVDVKITVPKNVYLVDGEQHAQFDKLNGGETKSMNYSLIVNNNYTEETIPINFSLTEKHGKYAEDRTINLAINQSFAQNKIEVKSNATTPQGNISIAKIDGGTKQADVDVAIPESGSNNSKTFAVVIANENYRRESAVRFASNDGNIVSQYLVKTLGLPNENVRVAVNATLNEIRDQISWLKNVAAAYKGEANLIVYYAGHGMPDEESGKAYLIPSDGNSSNSATCIQLNTLYDELSQLDVNRVCVFLDACFSGAQRGDGMLMAARGVTIKPKNDVLKGKLVVFSAAQGTETAYPYTEMGHGLFTYYLLKKLQDTKGNVSLGELGEYITNEVSRRSIVVNSKSQTPVTAVSTTLGDEWKKWTLR